MTRVSHEQFDEERLGQVRFVPLVGEDAWEGPGVVPVREPPPRGTRPATTAVLIREAGEPIAAIGDVDLGPLLDRIGRSKVVLLGEATHGTSEFYQMRARITRELITKRGYTIVAVEADWPDAARVDRYVRHGPAAQEGEPAFRRFPTWMWRNAEVHDFVAWLRSWNADRPDPGRRAGFYGLDLTVAARPYVMTGRRPVAYGPSTA